MSDLAHHKTESVQLIFLGKGKSDIMHTDHNCMDNIIVSIKNKIQAMLHKKWQNKIVIILK